MKHLSCVKSQGAWRGYTVCGGPDDVMASALNYKIGDVDLRVDINT